MMEHSEPMRMLFDLVTLESRAIMEVAPAALDTASNVNISARTD